MINLIKKFFSKRKPNDSSNQSEQLSSDIHIATCALFLEMANIDGEFSALEKENIISILKRDFDLSDEHAARLLEASNQELKKSIDIWKFTNRINQNYSMEEKIRVVETVWDVVYADGKLDKHENYLVHKLANLLHLSHKQLIDAKLKVKRSRPDQ
ncbi:MAG: TerB family tellurite resistance protein [Thermodesulfobacteriota bacterium]